jgi:hypothetical protein
MGKIPAGQYRLMVQIMPDPGLVIEGIKKTNQAIHTYDTFTRTLTLAMAGH